MPTPWSSPGVFNVLDPWVSYMGSYVGMIPGSEAAAAQNTAVLQGIINLAQTTKCGDDNQPPYAATIVFPGHATVPNPGSDGTDPGTTDVGAQYYFTSQSATDLYAALITCDNPIRFLGTGNVRLSMLAGHRLEPHPNRRLLSIQCCGRQPRWIYLRRHYLQLSTNRRFRATCNAKNGQ